MATNDAHFFEQHIGVLVVGEMLKTENDDVYYFIFCLYIIKHTCRLALYTIRATQFEQ